MIPCITCNIVCNSHCLKFVIGIRLYAGMLILALGLKAKFLGLGLRFSGLGLELLALALNALALE